MPSNSPTPYRRKRGTMISPARAGWLIEEETKLRVEALATHLKVSPSYFLERLVDHIEVDVRGIPSWWPQPELNDGELPIDSA